MYIDPKSLPPKYQAQIANKLLQNQRERLEEAEARKDRRKYRNTPDVRAASEGREIRFDSKKEAARFDELMLLQKAGKIRDLKLQPQFTLQEAYTTPEGVRVRAIRYQADFSYEEEYITDKESGEVRCGWRTVVEDVKSKATRTRVYAMKKKLLRERVGIDIREV